jgi:hypothetical protein
MYGMINKAIEGLIVSNFGEEKWMIIREKAGYGSHSFIGMNYYPDNLTYKLVTSASETLNKPADELLEAFGEYWILYTAEEGYGEMMSLGGNSFREFIENLNLLHFRIGNILPDLVMPNFDILHSDEKNIQLEYRSTRPGLAAMVTGLLRGLSLRFHTPCEIVRKDTVQEEGEYITLFEIRLEL